jgi:hypothetical protein
LLETPRGGERAGVYNKTPGVDKETPGVYPELDASANPERGLNEEPDDTDSIEANTVTSDEIVNGDNDKPPPLGGEYKSSDDEKEDDDEPETEPETDPEVPESEIHQLDLMTPSVQHIRGL